MGQSEESSMGVPAWAEISRDASQAGNMESRGGTSGFPVHRLETSPTIATYTGEREANTRTNTNTRPDQSPAVGPAEVVWKIKREHTSKNSQNLVDLQPMASIIQEEGLHDFPSNTKKVAENEKKWYKQFARNMGGMLEDKPYKNLQWPPPPNT